MLARWLALPALLLLLSGSALAQVAVPQLRGPVTDLTGTLTTEQIASLDRQLRDLQARKGNYLAILLVPTTQPEPIEQFSLRVAEAWKLRRAGVNDGLLIVVAKQDRAVRIEVDYGLEGAVPDVLANRIIEQVIAPRFRAGDYFGGLQQAVERLVALIEGEALPAPEPQRAPAAQGIGSVLPVLLMVVLVGGGILRRMLGTFGGASVTAGLAAAIVWFLTSTLIIAIGAAVVAFVIALLGGGGGGGWTSGGRRGWGGVGGWTGGGWGGGGGWS
ncbi:MAG TPA: TPM domain-containing protein, partial [Steroidobacteraceae bacterium]|nr:TPM domain-containing protein [Steroidobacteraceae bacterium]